MKIAGLILFGLHLTSASVDGTELKVNDVIVYSELATYETNRAEHLLPWGPLGTKWKVTSINKHGRRDVFIQKIDPQHGTNNDGMLNPCAPVFQRFEKVAIASPPR